MDQYLYIGLLVLVVIVLAILQYRVLLDDEVDERESTGTADAADVTDSPVTTDSGGWATRIVSALPAGVGVALLSAGIAVWLRPALVPPIVATAVEEVGSAPEIPFLVLGGVIGAMTLLIVTFGSRADARATIGDIDAPESIDRPSTTLPGEEIDAVVDELGNADAGSSDDERKPTTEHLRSLVIESLATHMGCTRSEARRRVERGEWTDRTDVAAFLGGPEAPDMPMWDAALDWVSADPAYQRRVRRTIAELDQVTTGGEQG